MLLTSKKASEIREKKQRAAATHNIEFLRANLIFTEPEPEDEQEQFVQYGDVEVEDDDINVDGIEYYLRIPKSSDCITRIRQAISDKPIIRILHNSFETTNHFYILLQLDADDKEFYQYFDSPDDFAKLQITDMQYSLAEKGLAAALKKKRGKKLFTEEEKKLAHATSDRKAKAKRQETQKKIETFIDNDIADALSKKAKSLGIPRTEYVKNVLIDSLTAVDTTPVAIVAEEENEQTVSISEMNNVTFINSAINLFVQIGHTLNSLLKDANSGGLILDSNLELLIVTVEESKNTITHLLRFQKKYTSTVLNNYFIKIHNDNFQRIKSNLTQLRGYNLNPTKYQKIESLLIYIYETINNAL